VGFAVGAFPRPHCLAHRPELRAEGTRNRTGAASQLVKPCQPRTTSPQRASVRGNGFQTRGTLRIQRGRCRLRKNSCFVSGHDFSRAVKAAIDEGFLAAASISPLKFCFRAHRRVFSAACSAVPAGGLAQSNLPSELHRSMREIGTCQKDLQSSLQSL
jgi:hypothetical protein